MMSEEEILWYRPELLVPVPTKPKEKSEKTIDNYLGEDDGQNLGDC
tara:strand:+ start:160 stop:297 length:138 start_codon:yes stop_codon:yes gene_type:complete